jgi:hypothetical protein
MQVQTSRTIQSPAEVIETHEGNPILVLNLDKCDPLLVQRLTAILRPFTTQQAIERQLTMKRYTYERTADLLGTSVKWLQRRVAKDLVPYVTDGHRVWFEIGDIQVIQRALRRGELDSLQGTGRHVPRRPQ